MTTEIDNNEVTNVLYAGTLLMTELSSLSINHYSCIKCTIEKSSASGGNRYRFKFESKIIKRIVSISYSPPTSETKLHCFNVSIESTDDRVTLDDLINKHSLFNDIDYLDLDTYEGDTNQKIQGVVKFIDKVFSANFHDIISGKEWEPVAFDWQGYK